MIQLILKALSLFCGLGGQYVMPIISPLINPFSWSAMVLCFFLPIYFSGENALNSDEKNGKLEKNSNKAFGYSFLIYYVVCVALVCSLYGTACKANEYNPYG